MILNNLKLDNVKGIRSLAFRDLSPDLCLFYGPNESGKSTVVQALHFALFEKVSRRTERTRSLRSWGSEAAPEIEVGLTDDEGEPWTVHKRFLDKPSVELMGRNQRFKGEEAERRLRAMFGTREGGRQGVRMDDLGIWPLLWVQQGAAGRPTEKATTDEARQQLRSTLASQTGQVTAGPMGLAVLTKARELYAGFWTPQGRENITVKRHREAKDKAHAALVEARARYDASAALSTRIEELRGIVDDLDRRAQVLRGEVGTLKRKAADAVQLKVDLDQAVQREELATLEASKADETLAARQQQEAELAHRKASLEALGPALQSAKERLDAVERRRSDARAAAEVAQAALVSAREAVRHARRAEAVARVRAEQARLSERVQRAQQIEREQRELDAELKNLTVRKDDVERLRTKDNERLAAEARVEAAAVRVSWQGQAPVVLNGQAVPAGGAWSVVAKDRTEVVVEGLGTLVVSPGEGTLAQLQADAREAVEAFERQLARVGVGSLAAAVARLDRRGALDAARRNTVSELRVLAPDGVAALEASLGALAQRLAELVPAGEPDPEAQDEADIARADEALVAAEQAEQGARARLEGLAKPLQEANEAVQQRRTEARLAGDEIARLTSRLSAAPPVSVLQERALACREAVAKVAAEVAGLQRQWTALGGASLQADIESMGHALKTVESRQREARDEQIRKDAELQTKHEEGLYEHLQAARAAYLHAQEVLDGVLARAAAARRLMQALDEAQAAVQDAVSAPVRAAVGDGVRILFPGSELEIAPSGDVTGLRTNNQVESFDVLSGGAREQFGLLVRLGLARVLAGQRRLPVLFDDALVNSDARRRLRMVQVMRRASEQLQVLVFTCHDEDFDQLAPGSTHRVDGRPGRRQ